MYMPQSEYVSQHSSHTVCRRLVTIYDAWKMKLYLHPAIKHDKTPNSNKALC